MSKFGKQEAMTRVLTQHQLGKPVRAAVEQDAADSATHSIGRH